MAKLKKPKRPVEQWEYMGSTTGFHIGEEPRMIRWLDEYGLEGWELVYFEKIPYANQMPGYHVDVLFKRKLKKYRSPKSKGHPGSW